MKRSLRVEIIFCIQQWMHSALIHCHKQKTNGMGIALAYGKGVLALLIGWVLPLSTSDGYQFFLDKCILYL